MTVTLSVRPAGTETCSAPPCSANFDDPTVQVWSSITSVTVPVK